MTGPIFGDRSSLIRRYLAMVDYAELMSFLSVPRPNGSAAEVATGRALAAWLTARGIPCRVHSFRLYPYFFEAVGVWLILSRTLLVAAIWLRWGLPSTVIGGSPALAIALADRLMTSVPRAEH